MLLVSAMLRGAELPFPTPRVNDLDDYLREAMTFVTKNPDSKHTPRVLMDILMVFTAGKKETDRDKIRRMLIAKYPESLEARFAITLFEDAGDYRDTLLKMFNDDEQGSKTGFGRGFLPRAMMGFRAYDTDIFKQSEFLVRSIFAAEEKGELRVKDDLMRLVRSDEVGNDNEKELMKIAFDNELDHAAKIRAVHEKEDCGTKKFLTNYLVSRLSEKERNAFPIQKVFIESKLKSSKWDEAIVLIDRLNPRKLSPNGSAHVQFWKGWALASHGTLTGADKTLATVMEKYGQTAWGRTAQTLRSALARQTDSLEANVNGLEGVIMTLGDDVEVLELKTDWDLPEGPVISVYFSYRKAASEVLLFLSRDGKVHLAYDFSPQRSRMYTGADAVTLVGTGQMPIFTPEFKFSESEDGRLNFSANAKQANSLEAGKSSLKSMLDNPLFNTRSGLTKLVGRSTKLGWLPTTATRDQQGRRVLEWISPKTSEPGFEKLRITTEKGMLRSVESDDGFQLRCRYGKANEVKLNPPKWPRSSENVVDKQNFGIALISKALPAIVEIGSK